MLKAESAEIQELKLWMTTYNKDINDTAFALGVDPNTVRRALKKGRAGTGTGKQIQRLLDGALVGWPGLKRKAS
jgi:sugar diacid utilization regulator